MSNNSNLKDLIYNTILEDILSLNYPANHILNEKKLVERFGCSKTPVREALISLCNDNVLRNIPRYGYEVIRITMEDIRDMLRFRYVLESGLLIGNYKRFTKSQIDRLAEINKSCHSSDTDIWAHWSFNSEFHLQMMSFCNNLYALSELQKCMDRLKRAYAQFYWNNLEEACLSLDTRNHEQIIYALRQKNLEKLLFHLKEDLKDFGGAHFISYLRLEDFLI
jgi:DNA-binding GntR family transcriptional regulator